MNTFAGFQSCPDLERLQAGIALIGIPYGTPYDATKPPHSLNAPEAIREESNRYPDDPIAWDFDLGGTLLPHSGVRVVDCGNLPGSQEDASGNRQHAQLAIEHILDRNAMPLVLGGDDSVPIPVMRAYEGRKEIHIIQLDAHIDWRDSVDGVHEGYSSTMRRASELNFVSGITQVGMRGVGSALQEEYQAAQEYGAQFFSARFVHKKGTEAVLSELPVGENCFLTIDLDVLDPSVMPAVGAPTPGGLGFRSLIDLIHGITDRMNIVGACVVELVPEADQGSLGVITAMRVVWNLIGAAARKR